MERDFVVTCQRSVIENKIAFCGFKDMGTGGVGNDYLPRLVDSWSGRNTPWCTSTWAFLAKRRRLVCEIELWKEKSQKYQFRAVMKSIAGRSIAERTFAASRTLNRLKKKFFFQTKTKNQYNCWGGSGAMGNFYRKKIWFFGLNSDRKWALPPIPANMTNNTG